MVLAGDLIVCPAETTIRSGFNKPKRLAKP